MKTLLVIEPGHSQSRYWRELWNYRELFGALVRRDVAVRYRQTVMGLAWALLRPFITMVVLTVVFGKVAGLPSDGRAPYALMVYAAVLPWQLFATALSGAADSLLSNGQLVGKIYFPRLVVPLSSIATALVDFLVSLAFLAGLMVWYGHMPGWQIVLLPAFIVLTIAAVIGPSLWLCAFVVKYRDVRFVVPFLVQIGMYISPVGFSSSVVPHEWRFLYSLNPLVGVIDGFRWCILGGDSPIRPGPFLVSAAIIALFLWLGLRRFRRTENRFADLM